MFEQSKNVHWSLATSRKFNFLCQIILLSLRYSKLVKNPGGNFYEIFNISAILFSTLSVEGIKLVTFLMQISKQCNQCMVHSMQSCISKLHTYLCIYSFVPHKWIQCQQFVVSLLVQIQIFHLRRFVPPLIPQQLFKLSSSPLVQSERCRQEFSVRQPIT